MGIGENFVNLPGVSGKVALDVRGTLRAKYSDRALIIGDASIEETGELVAIEPPGLDGFGANYATTVDATGNIEYQAGVTLYPNIELRVLGFTIVNKDLASFHFDVPKWNVTVDFDEQPARLDLPEIAFQPAELTIVGAAGAATLQIDNPGDAALQLEVESWPESLEPISGLMIVEPGASLEIIAGLRADVSSTGRFSENTTVSFRTNDPDQPLIEVPITITTSGEPDDDGLMGGAPGGGCAAGTSSSGGANYFFIACFVLFFVRLRSTSHF